MALGLTQTLPEKERLNLTNEAAENNIAFLMGGRCAEELIFNNYTTGVQHSPTLSPRLQKGIYLTSNEKVDLIAFLLTLSDKEFLFNTKYGYPYPAK